MRISSLLLCLTVGLAIPGLVQASSVPLASKVPTTTQVKEWINKQAENPIVTDSFDFQLVNLDQDPESEIVARHSGGVHLGNFYILDKKTYIEAFSRRSDRVLTESFHALRNLFYKFLYVQKQDRTYTLIAEEDWNPPRLPLDQWEFIELEAEAYFLKGKRLFETVNHTGGTGVSVYEAHLWYLDNGRLVNVWEGTLRETVSIPGGQLFETVGSYQIVPGDGEHPLLYHWQTKQELDSDTGKSLPDSKPETTLQIFRWEKGVFVKQ